MRYHALKNHAGGMTLRSARLLILAIIMLSVCSSVFASMAAKKTDLSRIFTAYGYVKAEQHLDVLRLLNLSGCFEPTEFRKDLKVTGHDEASIEHIVALANSAMQADGFHPEILLEQWPSADISQNTPSHPESLHNWLIRVTQRNFFAKAYGVERCEFTTLEWIKKNENNPEIANIIKNLGLKNAVSPNQKHYDAIVIFGSYAPEMKRRLEYAKTFINQGAFKTSALYLLCGERPAIAKGDGGQKYLEEVAEQYDIPLDKITETTLMQAAYDTSEETGGIFSKLAYYVVDTPKGTNPRPSTQDTIKQLLKNENFAKTQPKNLLFISHAPYIHTQKEIVLAVLAETGQNLSFEVVGRPCHDAESVHQIISAFGGILFWGYTRTAKALGSQKSLGELNAMLWDTLRFDVQ